MDDKDAATSRSYSAGLYFAPQASSPQRYEKRVLVPLAEYLPFEWCRSLVEGYGISDFYTRGQEAKVFAGHRPFSVSICYEETFPEIMREGKVNGAELFINLTNDNWYPGSRLSKQHFDHARLRAVENGTPLVRACNSGVTAVIDAQGGIVDQLRQREGVLYANVPLHCFSTPYTQFGDALIVGCSLGLLIAYFCYPARLILRRRM
jgi:apolipoprotein N-acyltransferase